MSRWYKIFARISFLTVVLIVVRIIGACAIWRPADDRSSTTGMFVVAKDALIDPDSIAVDYEDENMRRTSLCIFNDNSTKMVRMHFLEDKETADAYYSHDGVHYEEVRSENGEDMTNRAYHWMLSWLGSWE